MGTSTDALSGFVSDGWIGQPNIGLSPQKIQDLNRQADERIAAENKAKEEAKARKAAKKGKLPDLGSKSDDDYYQQQQAGGFLIPGGGGGYVEFFFG